MSAALAAAQWDTLSMVWAWSVADKFQVARDAIDDARDEGMPGDQWGTMVRTLQAARDEVPPDLDTARSLYITAKTWAEAGGEDWAGRSWSEAKESVGSAVGSVSSTVTSTVVPLLWGILVVGGALALANLVRG